MIKWLSGLTERYPGVANIPIILVLLCLCETLVFSLIQLSPALPPGRFGIVLAACLKVGGGTLFSCACGDAFISLCNLALRGKISR